MRKPPKTLRFATLIWREELHSITSSPSTLLVILGGVVFYSLLYNLLYRPNVVRDAPIVVVDESQSHASRELVERVDASPSASIVGSVATLSDGYNLLAGKQAQAILYLPYNFAKQIGGASRATLILLPSTTSLLYYEATAGAVMEATLALAEEYRASKMWLLPREVAVQLASSPTPKLVGNVLFNPDKGYADYLIPPVLLLIIFQTMTMAITMIHGARVSTHTTPTRGLIGGYGARAAEVASRTLFYTAIYGLLALFLLATIPQFFDLPHTAKPLTLIGFIVPFLIATSLFAQAFARLFKGSEDGLLFITFFSVGLIFLSGISFPLQQIPQPWRLLHYLLPATVGTRAYVGIGTMGATLSDISPQLWLLVVQSVSYFLLATITRKRGV